MDMNKQQATEQAKRTELMDALDQGGREVYVAGLVALPDKDYGADYLACFYGYIEASDDEEAFDRMVRLREVFAAHGYAADEGLVHLHDADGC